MTTKAAVVQLNADANVERNVAQAEHWIRQAAQRGACWIATPEATTFLGPHDAKAAIAQSTEGPLCRHFAALSRELGVWLLLGSFNEASGDPHRTYNTSVLFRADGSIAATYRKMHLFDVDIPGGPVFKESATTLPGDEPCTVDTPIGRLGLSICYDLRFPELYAALRARGATALAVPSAFTSTTGRAHWAPLLRARAIENQCWVFAPGQMGTHGDGGIRESHGQSMIVNPWGEVVSGVLSGPGVAVADIDSFQVTDIRATMNVQRHRRLT